MSETAAWPRRSSGTKAASRRRLRVMFSPPQGTPASLTASADALVRSPEMASKSSDWPLPRDTRHRDDLAGAHHEIDALQRYAERVVGRHGEAGELEQGLAGCRTAPRLDRCDVAADHEPGEGGGGFLLWIDPRHQAPMAQDRRVVAEAFDLFQAMGDVEECAAFAGQALQGDEELTRFLRRQDRGGFVQDQQARLLQKAAHDLDALAFAHREIRHERVGPKRQTVVGGDLLDPPRERRQVPLPLQGKRDVLRDGQRIEQREVLKHHADAQLPRCGRI